MESDKQLVQNTINQRWEYLRINSPNINLENPEAKIFRSKMQDENEVPQTSKSPLEIR